jgi:anti-sigma regulatory factor (Ser/Thr protein kinase)
MSITTLLPADPGAARLARSAVRRLCGSSGIGSEDVDTAVLLTSELVTNAVLHGGGPSVLSARLLPGKLRVAVTDRSTRPPRVTPPESPTAGSGRGLVLVARLADKWGHARTRTGKTVWFELAVA